MATAITSRSALPSPSYMTALLERSRGEATSSSRPLLWSGRRSFCSSSMKARGTAAYAAVGTLARQIIDGAKTVRIFDEHIPVRARIHTNGFSSHADQAELLEWQRKTAARITFLVHGEQSSTVSPTAKRRNGCRYRPDRQLGSIVHELPNRPVHRHGGPRSYSEYEPGCRRIGYSNSRRSAGHQLR